MMMMVLMLMITMHAEHGDGGADDGEDGDGGVCFTRAKQLFVTMSPTQWRPNNGPEPCD